MNEGKRLDSGFPPAGDRVDDYPPPIASERRPIISKFDPEYDVVASARCFRTHARLLIETAQTASSSELPALANYLTHVRELLFFTLGWLEHHRAAGAFTATPTIASVRDIVVQTRSAPLASADEVLALAVSFDELAKALEAI